MTKSNTHKTSFKAAKAAAKKNPGVRYTSDAGEGWTAVIYYCTWRKRLIAYTINPDGIKVVSS